MPSDMAIQYDARQIAVCGPDGTRRPFSKGLLATSILATGVETDVAYAVARKIERTIRLSGLTEISLSELDDLATRTIETEVDPVAARRFQAWNLTSRSSRSVLIVLGGAPGVGKSTLATRLAVRLGFTRVVTTDTIREVLRTTIPREIFPELHVSTFERVDEFREQTPLSTFERQARSVGAATAAVAERLATENRNAIIEGAHLLPGQVRDALASHPARPIVVEMTLTLDSEQRHLEHLDARAESEPIRRSRRHVQKIDAIRGLQDYLIRMARENRIPTFDVNHPETLTQQIVDAVAAEMWPSPLRATP